MSEPDLTLYGLRLSGHSHRAELFLSLLGLPYRFVEVASAEQRTAAEFRRLNPLGQIPVLTDGATAGVGFGGRGPRPPPAGGAAAGPWS